MRQFAFIEDGGIDGFEPVRVRAILATGAVKTDCVGLASESERMTNHPIDVKDIMREIKGLVRSRGTSPAHTHTPTLRAPAWPGWTRSDEAGVALKNTQSLIGQLPPEPPTLRGRVGIFLVKIVRRALFWYTPQIVEFHKTVTSSFNELLAAIKTVAAAGQQNWTALESLNLQTAELRAETERLEKMLESLRKELGTIVKAELSPEIAARHRVESRLEDTTRELDDLAKALAAETGEREELARRVKTEIASREGLANQLDGEIAAREGLTQALAAEVGTREELVRRVEAEIASREGLADRLDGEIAAREGLTQTLATEVGIREGLVRRVEAEIASREGLADRLDGEIASREGLTEALAAEVGIREELVRRMDAEIASREALAQALDGVSNRSQSVEAAFRHNEIRMQRLRDELINQSRRVSMLLEEARKRLPAPFDEPQLSAMIDEEKHALDAVYVAFEDTFRGTREEIKDRSRVYLPLLHEHKIGTHQMPILDLGCGRGEWLELLLEGNLVARGIDINRVLLAHCKDAGLNVEEDDLLQHLRKQPSHSLGAVTGFHIIEHLPFDLLVRVFDETVRVLKPGGLAIFETPNPQNVLVGSHNFYLDFTHRNPLPPLTTQFILEARGLCDVQILPLHPYPECLKLQDDRTELAKRFNEYFYGPQDYAVIGRKA